MKIAFILSMPGSPSWNRRWSGEGNLYAIIQSFTGKKGAAKAEEILTKSYYSYGWSDGWRASIKVKQVDAAEAKKIKTASRGFCGYEWMVESILSHGAIYASHDEIPKEETQPA